VTSREEFEGWVQEAIDSLPPDLAELIDNVLFVVEDEPPKGEELFGEYYGVPQTERGVSYSGALPDVITIFRAQLERDYGANPAELRIEIRRTVLHEIAHYFGISDERLVELDRY
jgi:predicted Zn-dependent protease with MMP-like domain